MTEPRRTRRLARRRSGAPAGMGRWLAAFGTVAGAELQRWRRERLAVASAFLLPVGMAALVSLALGRELPEVRVRVLVVDHEQGPASAAFVDEALGHPAVAPLVEVEEIADERRAARILDAEDETAVVVLPEDLTARLAAGVDAGIEVRATDPVSGELVATVAEQFTVRAGAAAIAARRTGSRPVGPWPLEVELTAPGGRRLDAATHYGPAIGMFFVLVGLGFTAQRRLSDRRRGVVDRLASAPVAASAVAVGRTVAAVAVGGLSLATTALSMQLLFGRSWGPLGPVAALIAAVVVAMAGVAAAVTAVCRSSEQVQLLTAGLGMVFALASGSFSPPGSLSARPVLAELVPTTHALDGFALLATEHAPLAEVVGPIAILAGFGLLGLLAAGALAQVPVLQEAAS